VLVAPGCDISGPRTARDLGERSRSDSAYGFPPTGAGEPPHGLATGRLPTSGEDAWRRLAEQRTGLLSAHSRGLTMPRRAQRQLGPRNSQTRAHREHQYGSVAVARG